MCENYPVYVSCALGKPIDWTTNVNYYSATPKASYRNYASIEEQLEAYKMANASIGGVVYNAQPITFTYTTSSTGNTGTTGGNKVTNVNVADLFEVYPELAPKYYDSYAKDEYPEVERDFAENVRTAAEHLRGKKAVKALNKLNNKEDK